MIITWMVGSVLFTTLAALAALAAERASVALRFSRRWPWLFALAAGTLWPIGAGIAYVVTPRAVTLPRALIGTQSPSAVGTVAAQLPSLTAAWSDAIGHVLIAIWVLASLVLVARLVVGMVRLRRVDRSGSVHDVDGMQVLVTDSFGPAVYGVRNPRIVVPRWLLDLEPPLRSLVLTHEHQHLARGDAAVILASAVASALVPWNPAIWWMTRRVRLAVELDCDGRVIAATGGRERYCKLLLLIAQKQSHSGLVPMLAESNADLGTRIAEMNAPKQPRSYTRAAAFAAVAAGLTALACSSEVMNDVTAPSAMSASRMAGVEEKKEREKVFFDFQVGKAVTHTVNATYPKFPELLKMAGVEGEVLAQFVVDTGGVAMEGSLKVLKSSHALFAQSVKNALPDMRFNAAELNGRKVRQLVHQVFVFGIASSGPAIERIGPDSAAIEAQKKGAAASLGIIKVTTRPHFAPKLLPTINHSAFVNSAGTSAEVGAAAAFGGPF